MSILSPSIVIASGSTMVDIKFRGLDVSEATAGDVLEGDIRVVFGDMLPPRVYVNQTGVLDLGNIVNSISLAINNSKELMGPAVPTRVVLHTKDMRLLKRKLGVKVDE